MATGNWVGASGFGVREEAPAYATPLHVIDLYLALDNATNTKISSADRDQGIAGDALGKTVFVHP